MQQSIWFERKFLPLHDNALLPNIIGRLEGVIPRLKDKLIDFPNEMAELNPGNKWSIKEEIGHLTDLEPLWLARVEELLDGEKFLSPADLSNTKTHEADHNQYLLQNLVKHFESKRIKLVNTFKKFDENTIDNFALHPRLKKPMKVVDLAFFIAEHDDHHLAKISHLISLVPHG